jgi:hypothetical protein
MKGIILYQSKSGATKRYADWLIEKTGFDRDETNRKKGVLPLCVGIVLC